MQECVLSTDRRSVRTRRALRQALAEEICSTGDLSRVTVTAVTERAGVTRRTFYSHFRDIPDLVNQIEEETLSELRAPLARLAACHLDDLRAALLAAVESDASEVTYTAEDGSEHTYSISYDAYSSVYNVTETTTNTVYDRYASPSAEHWLGTDGNGMDMLTRLMYGGRVSLIIGFIVVFIAAGLGVIMGGISGYFGGWVDNLIMRIVDVFYCLPSMPIIIILGSAMDSLRLDSWTRMIYLMLVLGFLSWPSIARLVRGQILSLREQEFMLATEATGISVPHRIIRHLIPNVMPQLIVSCTMSLGSTIITEATLSFLGLGVKFPFASWGNIISDVNNAYVMTNYWFIWIPAGICLLLAVLGFNFVGDGLRDAFDPKMNR